MSSPYADANGVFINKLGLKDEATLRAAEYRITEIRGKELESGIVRLPVENYGLERQQAMHKRLFKDVYAWAGELRTVPSAKRVENKHNVPFCRAGKHSKRLAGIREKTLIIFQ